MLWFWFDFRQQISSKKKENTMNEKITKCFSLLNFTQKRNGIGIGIVVGFILVSNRNGNGNGIDIVFLMVLYLY